MKTLTWQKPGQQNVAQELIKIIINYVAELRDKKYSFRFWRSYSRYKPRTGCKGIHPSGCKRCRPHPRQVSSDRHLSGTGRRKSDRGSLPQRIGETMRTYIVMGGSTAGMARLYHWCRYTEAGISGNVT